MNELLFKHSWQLDELSMFYVVFVLLNINYHYHHYLFLHHHHPHFWYTVTEYTTVVLSTKLDIHRGF